MISKKDQTILRLQQAFEDYIPDPNMVRGSAAKTVVKASWSRPLVDQAELPELPPVVHSSAIEEIQAQTRQRLRQAVMSAPVLK